MANEEFDYKLEDVLIISVFIFHQPSICEKQYLCINFFKKKCLSNPNNLSIFAKIESAKLPLRLANLDESYITKYHGKCRIKDNRTHLHPIRTAGESFFYKL